MCVYEEEEEKLKCIKVPREIILNNFIWEGMQFTTGQCKPGWNSARKWWKHYAGVVLKVKEMR